jgi:type VI secretion system secreted protein Hcp
MATGGGGGTGRANFDALSFVHYVDRASPNIFQYCAAGKHIVRVELSVCKAGDGSQEYVRITLKDVLVVRVATDGVDKDLRAKEIVSLSYAEIKVEAREQNADGSTGASVIGGWSVKENRAA